ncbi:MAG: glycosyltransferase 87 family protein [Actinomycetota bacterium]
MSSAERTRRWGRLGRAIDARPTWAAAAVIVLVIGTMLVIAVGSGGPMKDLNVYLLAGRVFSQGGDLYAGNFGRSLSTPLPYTYPPLWAAVLASVAWLPWSVTSVGWNLLNVALLLWVTHVSYRAFLDGRGARRPVALACVAGIMAFSAPVLSVFDLGQVGILLLAMVLADTVAERTRLPRGVLVGAATAIKLTPGIFIVYWLATRRWRPATIATATVVGLWGLSALLRPDLSHTYWFEIAFRPDRAGDLGAVIDQSMNGVLLRLGLTDPAIWAALAAAALGIGLVRARAAHRVGDELAAITLIGIASVLVSPVSWIHHAVWIVPATGVILGDGSSRGRRLVWTATVVLFLLHVPVWSTLVGLPSGGFAAIVLENAYVWAAWALLLFLPARADAHGTGAQALPVGRRGVSVP